MNESIMNSNVFHQKKEEEDTSVNPEIEVSDDTDEEVSSPLRTKKSSGRGIIMNVALTKYPVVRSTAKSFKWKLTKKEDDDNWDIFWTDAAVQPEKLAKMKLYQKINHFPGMYALARKNFLAKNLTRIRKVYPKAYNFFPRTWLIPAEYPELLMNFTKKSHKKVFIVKPEASCQGRGIFLTKKIDDFSADDRYVVQEYISRPFLIDNLKFDLRIYVLVAGCDPLRIYLHEEGLARFATEAYVKPTSKNLTKQCMHLTNYAINKNSENFVFNEDPKADNIGHKRSLSSTLKQLADMGHDTKKLWARIKDIIVKTLCAVQPSLAHIYKACQPDDPYNGMCFEILGFDIILDHKLKPWLLEVNHSPSFTTDSPLDLKIKFEVISQALRLLNIKSKNRMNYYKNQKKAVIERSVTKTSGKSKDKKELASSKAQGIREKWEKGHLGGYTKIYEKDNFDEYKRFIETATEIWNELTGGKAKIKRNENTGSIGKGLNEAKIEVRSSSVKVPKIYSQSPVKEKIESVKATRAITVFERLSQVPLKKQTVVDINLFPCVKFEENSTTVSLPMFIETNLNHSRNERISQKQIRMNESDKKGHQINHKEIIKYSDFPLLIQSAVGNDHTKQMISNDHLNSRCRVLTPGYRKRPYQYTASPVKNFL